MGRIALFESDLELLGLTMEAAPGLDQKQLRTAFRKRSRDLHPDAAVPGVWGSVYRGRKTA